MAAMCRFPGCIAEASNGECCYVHAMQQGKPCDSCRGKGTRPHFNKKTGQLESIQPCDRCAATGLKDQHTGVPKVKREPVDDRGLIQLADEPEPQ